MAGPFANGTGAAASLGLKALGCRTFAHNRFLDDQVLDVKIVIIFGIGHGTGQRLPD